MDYIPSPKTLFKDLSSINFNWLVFVVWKMTWGIWQIFTRALEGLKIEILMGSFKPKLKKYELKMHRGVICHETKEGYKIWSGINLLFQYWHKEFDKFWGEHSKVSIKFHFNGLLLNKVYIAWAKKVQRSYLSWHWRVIQNLERNWLVVWKLTWGISQILTWALESLNNFHF